MSSSATTKLQVNFKTRSSNPQFASLLNVYADDADDLNVQLQGLIDNLPKISEIEQLLGAAEVVVAVTTQATPAAGPVGDGPVCQHGPMTRNEATRKSGPNAGKRAVDYHCSQPQGAADKCASQWGKAF